MLLHLVLAVLLCCRLGSAYYTYEGNGSNPDNPTFGAKELPFVLVQVQQDANYAPSYQPTGSDLKSAREVSVRLMSSPYIKKKTPSAYTDMLTYFGQFFSHEVAGVALDANSTVPLPVAPNDPFWTAPNQTLKFTRSKQATVAGSRGTSTVAPINVITPWVDGSVIYGESAALAKVLRSMQGGLMNVDRDNNLPLNNVNGQELYAGFLKNDAKVEPNTNLRLSGEERVNQNPGRLAFTTLFVREHNRRAAELAAANPTWTDEQLYQRARAFTVAHLQRITYLEYVPQILGGLLQPYRYNRSANPQLDLFFMTVAYRYGHTEINPTVLRVDNNGAQIPEGHLLLHDIWYRPSAYLQQGIAPVFRGMALNVQGAVEPRWTISMQQHMFGYAGINGSDIVTRNIMRARDHGIPNYGECRRQFGLPVITEWPELSNDTALLAALRELYPDGPATMDPYIGGLLEPKMPHSHVGALFHASFVEQYTRTRDADFWWWENTASNGLFSAAEHQEIAATGLRDIILRNIPEIDATRYPANVWRIENLDQPWPSSTCAANTTGAPGGGGSGGVSGGGGNTSSVVVLAGNIRMNWTYNSVNITVTLSAAGRGWVGFGIARDETSFMNAADMVIATFGGDVPLVSDYWSTGIGITPQLDVNFNGGSDNVHLLCGDAYPQCGYDATAGRSTVTFTRPLLASDPGLDRTIDVTARTPVLLAYHPSVAVIGPSAYHLPSGRIPFVLTFQNTGEQDVVLNITDTTLAYRQQHGILMSVTFTLLYPLGALVARNIRNMLFIRNIRLKAAMFYSHIVLQVTVTILGTAGFALAVQQFQKPYAEVAYGHGSMGVAVISLTYFQLLVGFLRPPGDLMDRKRRVWEMMHVLVGRLVIGLGILNVALGLAIWNFLFAQDIGTWAALITSSLLVIALTQYALDRLEKQIVLDGKRVAGGLTADNLEQLAAHEQTEGPGGGSMELGHRTSTLGGHDNDNDQEGPGFSEKSIPMHTTFV